MFALDSVALLVLHHDCAWVRTQNVTGSPFGVCKRRMLGEISLDVDGFFAGFFSAFAWASHFCRGWPGSRRGWRCWGGRAVVPSWCVRVINVLCWSVCRVERGMAPGLARVALIFRREPHRVRGYAAHVWPAQQPRGLAPGPNHRLCRSARGVCFGFTT